MYPRGLTPPISSATSEIKKKGIKKLNNNIKLVKNVVCFSSPIFSLESRILGYNLSRRKYIYFKGKSPFSQHLEVWGTGKGLSKLSK